MGRVSITASQGWGRLPAGNLERVIPGSNPNTHPERLSTSVPKGSPGKLDVFTCKKKSSSQNVEESKAHSCLIRASGARPHFDWEQRHTAFTPASSQKVSAHRAWQRYVEISENPSRIFRKRSSPTLREISSKDDLVPRKLSGSASGRTE